MLIQPLAEKQGESGAACQVEAMTGRKEVVTEPAKPGESLKVSNIHNPSLIIYLPSKDKATGAAMIIAPGGGHRFLSIDSEGTNVCASLQ